MALCTPGSYVCNMIDGMNSLTGDPFVSILIFFIIGVAFLIIVLKIPPEWTAIATSGVVLTLLAYNSEWLAFWGLIVFIFAAIAARFWITNS